MAGIALVTSGLFAGLGMWVLAPSGSFVSSSARRMEIVTVARMRLERLCAHVGAWRLVELVAQNPSWSRAADVVASEARRRGVSLPGTAAVAAILVAVAFSSLSCSILSASAVGALVPVIACPVAIPVWAGAYDRRRSRALAREMPDIFRSLAGSLGAGQTLAQSIEYVAEHERGPAAPEFTKVALKLRCGIAVDQSLEELAQSLDAPGVGLLAGALLISQRTGSPLRGLFLRAANLVERQGEFEQSLLVKTAQVRLSVRIVCILPLVMVGLLMLISPDFQKGVISPVGTGCILIAVALDATAVLIIRRLMRGVV